MEPSIAKPTPPKTPHTEEEEIAPLASLKALEGEDVPLSELKSLEFHNYLLKCTSGIFEGKFFFINKTQEGELIGGVGDPGVTM